MAYNSTNWTPVSIKSTNWNKNSSLSAGIQANSIVVQANSTTVLATGYTFLNINTTENINSTNFTPLMI